MVRVRATVGQKVGGLNHASGSVWIVAHHSLSSEWGPSGNTGKAMGSRIGTSHPSL